MDLVGLVTLSASHKNTLNLAVRVPADRIQSWLTVSTGKCVVAQTAPEKDGEAYFMTVSP